MNNELKHKHTLAIMRFSNAEICYFFTRIGLI